MSQAHRSDDHDFHDFARAWMDWLRRELPGIVNDALTAFLLGAALWLTTQIGPRVEEVRANAEVAYAQRMADVDRAYCEKWGVGPGSLKFNVCARDLERLRSRDVDCRMQNLMSM